jgi:hypothetical protein
MIVSEICWAGQCLEAARQRREQGEVSWVVVGDGAELSQKELFF